MKRLIALMREIAICVSDFNTAAIVPVVAACCARLSPVPGDGAAHQIECFVSQCSVAASLFSRRSAALCENARSHATGRTRDGGWQHTAHKTQEEQQATATLMK